MKKESNKQDIMLKNYLKFVHDLQEFVSSLKE